MARKHQPIILAILYAGFALAWVIFAEAGIRAINPGLERHSLFHLAMGLTFVGVTSIALFWWATHWLTKIQHVQFEHEAVLDALPDLLFELDTAGRYLRLHAPRQELLAAPPEQLLGKTVSDVLPAAAAETVLHAIGRAKRDGYSDGDVIELALEDGAHWFELSVARKQSENDGPDTFIVLSRDITLRRLAEQRLLRTARELRETDALYRKAFLTSPDAVNITRRTDGVYLDVNAGFERISGWSRQEVVGRSALDVHIWNDRSDRQRLLAALSATGHCENMEFVFRRKDGSTLIGLMSAQTLDWQGTPCILTITRDISPLRAAQTRLHQLSAAVEQSPSSIVITDLEAKVVFANAAFCHQTGYSLDELRGQGMRVVSSGQTTAATYDELWSQLNKGLPWRGELLNRRKDGTLFSELTLISPVRNDAGTVTHFVAVKEDVTERKSAEERIRLLAHYDPLTGLPNRALLQERSRIALSLTQRNGSSLVVMFLDLDHFKHINDTLGHALGDELLIEIGRRLKTVLRDEDTVSRLGGDEFVLILPGADANGATTVAEKLLELIPLPHLVGDKTLATTCSIGIAIYPKDGHDMDALYHNADAAMYRAKREGRNGFRFHA